MRTQPIFPRVAEILVSLGLLESIEIEKWVMDVSCKIQLSVLLHNV